MSRKSLQALGGVVLVSVLVAGIGVGTVSAAQPGPANPARPVEKRPPVAPAAPVPPVRFDDRDARDTQQQLRHVLRQYPPSVEQVLRLDPSLMSREDYLAPYPTLTAFLAQHPEVARNPSFFFGQARFDEPLTTRVQAMQTFRDVLTGLGVFLFFMTALSVVAWVARGLMEHRRWLRVTKMQTEAHSKLLDRLTSNEDLLAYIQSPAGRHFLESAPIPVDRGLRAVSAPVGRILWSVQAGVVLAVVGVGVWFVKNSLIEELAGPLYVVGVLAISLGVGFVLSAFVAYVLSQRLGLLEPPRADHA